MFEETVRGQQGRGLMQKGSKTSPLPSSRCGFDFRHPHSTATSLSLWSVVPVPGGQGSDLLSSAGDGADAQVVNEDQHGWCQPGGGRCRCRVNRSGVSGGPPSIPGPFTPELDLPLVGGTAAAPGSVGR